MWIDHRIVLLVLSVWVYMAVGTRPLSADRERKKEKTRQIGKKGERNIKLIYNQTYGSRDETRKEDRKRRKKKRDRKQETR